MSRGVFLDDDVPRGPRPPAFAVLAVAAGIFAVAGFWFFYSQFRIDVPAKHMAILIRKDGLDLENNDEVAPTADHKGVQREVLAEGRYFRNPIFWDWEVVPQVEIPDGKLGVLISLTGDDLPYGQFLAEVDKEGTPTSKGIVSEILRPGRYPVNPYLFDVETHEPKVIPAGFKGVVTNLAGKFPQVPNQLLSDVNERGVQSETLEAGTYFVNPYVTRVNLVDCRSQRLNLAENDDMGFPSKDGFWVSLDGIVEFRVKPEKAAEIYVLYNESTNGDSVDEELIRKVILPNARSFCRLEGSSALGREFIQGETRTLFQAKFQKVMQEQCEPLGIEIIQALITKIKPPERIAKIVRDREIAKQAELQYVQEILQQKSEENLAIQQALVKRGQALVQAEQEIVKVTTQAEREQKVAITKAEENEAVAQLKLDAAKDEAAAVLARGKAEAEVVQFKNMAEAAGWKNAVEAFSGDGKLYAQFILYEKMASAYTNIMINTADSPIMKVFETFTNEATPGPMYPQRTAEGNEKSAPADADAPVANKN